MTPEFANVVDPIFLEIIAVLGEISDGNPDSVEQIRIRLDRQFQQADAALGESQEWLLAKYALAAFCDERLKQAPWDGALTWTEKPLEFYYFQSNEASVDFFFKAREAQQLTGRNALETFYVCVALGFRGLYQLEEKDYLTEAHELPSTIEEWAAKVATGIALRQGRGRFHEVIDPVQVAEPLEGKYQLVAAMLLLMMLSIILAGSIFLYGNEKWQRSSQRDDSKPASVAVALVASA